MSMRQRAGGKPSDSKRRRADSCSRAGTTRFHPGPGNVPADAEGPAFLVWPEYVRWFRRVEQQQRERAARKGEVRQV